jgi:ABC-type nitrate/sulfonate/bicarbonate transport system permease component
MSKARKAFLGVRGRIRLIKALTILAFILVWQGAALSGLFFEGVVPPPLAVAVAIGHELADAGFYHDLTATILAAAVGFGAGAILAVLIGILLGMYPFARRVFEPWIVAVGGTPKIIFLPILFLIFGLGIESKIAKAALSTFFPVVLSTTNGFVQIPPILLKVGQSFQVNAAHMAFKIYLPAMADALLTGLRLGMAMSIIGVLSAEISYSNAGLGFRLMRDADQFKMASVYALVLLIFAIAAIIDFVFMKVRGHFLRHGRGHDSAELKLPMAAATSASR